MPSIESEMIEACARYDESDAELQQKLQQWTRHFRKHDMHLVIAESCTGGWIGKLCSDLSGSSSWFEASIVTYSNRSKCALLKVEADTLSNYGAVSEQTVLEMSRGALEKVASANVSVAVSGIAGPDGGTDRVPVGTVWVAWHRRGYTPVSRRFHFRGTRDRVRFSTVCVTLSGLTAL